MDTGARNNSLMITYSGAYQSSSMNWSSPMVTCAC